MSLALVFLVDCLEEFDCLGTVCTLGLLEKANARVCVTAHLQSKSTVYSSQSIKG